MSSLRAWACLAFLLSTPVIAAPPQELRPGFTVLKSAPQSEPANSSAPESTDSTSRIVENTRQFAERMKSIDPVRAYEAITTLSSHPTTRAILAFLSSPKILSGMVGILNSANKLNLLFAEIALWILILLFRSWRLTLVDHWFRKLIVLSGAESHETLPITTGWKAYRPTSTSATPGRASSRRSTDQAEKTSAKPRSQLKRWCTPIPSASPNRSSSQKTRSRTGCRSSTRPSARAAR